MGDSRKKNQEIPLIKMFLFTSALIFSPKTRFQNEQYDQEADVQSSRPQDIFNQIPYPDKRRSRILIIGRRIKWRNRVAVDAN